MCGARAFLHFVVFSSTRVARVAALPGELGGVLSTDTTTAALRGPMRRCRHAFARAALLLLGALCLLGGGSREAAAQYGQQGSTLVASDAVEAAALPSSQHTSAGGRRRGR